MTATWKRAVFFFGILFNQFYGTHQLKDVRIKVPAAVKRGENVTFQCLFNLEDDKLYSVKWYRGAREFYRYAPNLNPPLKQFKIPGLNVVENASNDTHLVLENVSRENGGAFSCEVTTEGTFLTGMKTSDLQVVDLPKKDTTISGVRHRYRPGEVLKANCTCGESSPPVNLTWYINGIAANDQLVRHLPSTTLDNNQLEKAQSTLQFIINRKLFENGRLKIRCSASLYNLYHHSTEKSVALDKKKLRHHNQHHHNANSHQEIEKNRIHDDNIDENENHAQVPETWLLPQSPPQTTLTFLSPMNSLGNSINFNLDLLTGKFRFLLSFSIISILIR